MTSLRGRFRRPDASPQDGGRPAHAAEAEPRRRGSGRPLSISFGASAVVQGLTIVTGVLLARELGPTGRGDLAAVLLWPAILAAVGSVGMPDSTTYFAARPGGKIGTLVGTSLSVGIVQSAALVGIGAAIVPLVHHGSGAHTRGAAYLALAYIPLYLLTLYLMNILNGLHRFAAFQALRVIVFGGTAVLLIALAAAGHLGVRSATAAYLAAHLAAGVVAAVLAARAGALPLGFDRKLVRDMLGFGLRSHVSGVSAMLNERLDQLVISVFLAPAKLGLYVIAVTLTSLNNLVGTSVSLIALPSVARLAAGPERTSAARRFVWLTVVAATAVSIPMIVFTSHLIELFFGKAYLPATDVCRVLLVATVLFSTNRSIGAVLKAVGRPLDAGVAELVALGVTFASLAALLPTLGIMGAGVASLLAYGVSTAWMTRRASRALEIGWRSLLLPSREDLRVLGAAGLAPLARGMHR